MKKIIYTIFAASVLALTSCVDYFLQKPQGNDLTENDIFTSREQTLSAIAQAYQNALCMNLPYNDWATGTISLISGEINARKFLWETYNLVQRSGMSATGNTIDDYGRNFTAIRTCYLVHDNIDMMPESEMSAQEKSYVKGEMLTLVAYRYCRMFIQYGGVPVVDGLVDPGNSRIARAPLADVLGHIVKLCDNAFALLPDVWEDNFKGRITKAVPLAIKAQALLYAARPLFNSEQPYLSMTDPSENDRICFGNYSVDRWEEAYQAALDVIEYSEAHGFEIIDTGSPLDDYGTAVSVPNNREVLLFYKHQHVAAPTGNGNFFYPRQQSGGANGMSLYQIKQYYTVDGGDVVWPEPGDTWLPFSDFQAKVESLEPRYWASAAPAGYAAKNNPDDYYWTPAGGLTWASTWENTAQNEACGRRVKFWYKAGNRDWFDFPIYRLAYFYLAAAEAANEAGHNGESLRYLNRIRERAGFTTEISETDRTVLRGIIQREWAVEFYDENHRLFDVKHWKLPDIGNGIIGGTKYVTEFQYVNGTYGTDPSTYSGYKVAAVYDGYWAVNQYLNPFPTDEVAKGYLGAAPANGQNPGY